jgi:hypothetical protein
VGVRNKTYGGVLLLRVEFCWLCLHSFQQGRQYLQLFLEICQLFRIGCSLSLDYAYLYANLTFVS